MVKLSKIITIISVILFIIAIIGTAYIMKNGVGIIPGVNVGSGQYYFTDLPNWKNYFINDNYVSPVGIPLLTFLFVVWGVLMFKLWVWLDKKL